MAKMKPRTLAAIGRWGVLLPPALMLLGAGLNKFMDRDRWDAEFIHWGYGTALVPVIGAAEMAAGVLMFAGPTRFYGGVLGVGLMLGAAVTHIMAGEYVNILANIFIGGLAGVTAWWARPEIVERLLHRGE